MTGWEIVEVDAHDEAQRRAWWEAAHAAQARFPRHDNTHMNAINERMGYRVVEQFHELQKRL